MSGATNVPSATLGPNGYVAPTEAEILAGVWADLNAAFNGNLNTTNLGTPQGQLATTETAIIGDMNSQFLFFVSQVDPAFSSGRMQDGIGRIYFIARNPPQPTAVQATCTGLAGTVIPVGALAVAADGNLYAATASGTIAAGGTVSIPFACTVNGPISCPATTLSGIYQTIPGWDTITNLADGVAGNNVESRGAFEARRYASVQKNASGFNQAVLGAVLAVANVIDAYVIDNDESAPQTIGGVTLPANSLYVAVSGGADADVAAAIWSKKAPGCSYCPGTSSVVVTDTSYPPPQPSYTVLFTRATNTPVLFQVTIVNSSLIPTDAAAQVQAAIVSAFTGGDGGPRARIGSTVFASRFYAPVAALGAWAQIVAIQVGLSSPVAFSATLGIAQAPVVSAADITVLFQ